MIEKLHVHRIWVHVVELYFVESLEVFLGAELVKAGLHDWLEEEARVGSSGLFACYFHIPVSSLWTVIIKVAIWCLPFLKPLRIGSSFKIRNHWIPPEYPSLRHTLPYLSLSLLYELALLFLDVLVPKIRHIALHKHLGHDLVAL